MDSSNQYDYQKSSAPTAPSGPAALPPFSHPTAANGIPVNYANQNYYGNNYSQPAQQQGYYGNTQPPPQQVVQPAGGEGPWSSGLCDCFSDASNCCITCCCPCITFGQISEIVDKGSSSCLLNGALYALINYLTCCGCLYSCFYRSKLRQQYRLQENPCGDCLVHCCCETCALCQEYRELKSRGFNMAIGWDGNVERQNGGVAMPPVVQGGMNRY